MPGSEAPAMLPRPRLPDWLRIRLPTSDQFAHTRALLQELKLNTVCQSAMCPNHWECWSKGTATFMIGGERCTRACGFCAVSTAKPLPLDPDEPNRVAEATHRMRLRHVVITGVARDDLPDGGSNHFCQSIRAVRKLCPQTVIEVLTPDFNDRDPAIDGVIAARPHIFNHNLETVRRLTPSVRSRATYDRSLNVLSKVKHSGLLPIEGNAPELPGKWKMLSGAWYTLKLREDLDAVLAADSQFALFMQGEKARTAKTFQHARALKVLATLLAVALLMAVMAGAFYILKNSPVLGGR